jgi:predicted AAA+ superfamily ATPase
MIDLLLETSRRLMASAPVGKHRFLFEKFAMNERLTGLIGPRGVGKTTLLLQYLRENHGRPGEAIYASADHLFFNRFSLLEFVREVHVRQGVRYFVFDEIHKYRGWQQELKNIHDSFPEVRVAFSGSSNMALQQGGYDLSRRVVMHRLPGLSFREYLNFVTGATHGRMSLEAILDDPAAASEEISKIPRLLGFFEDYLAWGYYPFVFEGKEFFYEKLRSVLDKTIHEDIAAYYPLKTENLGFFKKILAFLATVPPGGVNIHKVATNLGIDDKTVGQYLKILQETGLLRLAEMEGRGHSILRRVGKFYLDNTTLHHAVCQGLGQSVDVGTARELFFLQSLENAGHPVRLSLLKSDFQVAGNLFEVGGPNKRRKQLPGTSANEFVVKDGILPGSRGTIPLHVLGFLY